MEVTCIRSAVHGKEDMKGGSPGAAGAIAERLHDSLLFAVNESKENLMTTAKKFLRLPAVIETTG